MNVDWSAKRNVKYLIALVVFLFVIPHVVMSLPHYRELNAETWGFSAYGFSLQRISLCTIWMLTPFAAELTALCQVRKTDQTCPWLVLAALLALVTYLLRIEGGGMSVLVLSASVLIMVLLECLPLLRPCEEGHGGNGLLHDIAVNRRFLELFLFWTLGIGALLCIAHYYLFVLWSESLAFFITLPLMVILPLLVLFQRKEPPLTKGGLLATFVIVLLSVPLCGLPSYMVKVFYETQNRQPYTADYQIYWSMGFLVAGYVLFLLAEGILCLGRTRRQRRGEEKKPMQDSPA